jgi:hypothetical protein
LQSDVGFLVVEYNSRLLVLSERPNPLDIDEMRHSLLRILQCENEITTARYSSALDIWSNNGRKQYRRAPSELDIIASRRDCPLRLIDANQVTSMLTWFFPTS